MEPVTFEEAMRFIHAAQRFGSRLGLKSIGALLARLGNPQDALKYVHVAGTNGKGSVCAYLAAILRAAGLKTGLYTSPYIQRFTERIQVDGVEISEDSIARITARIKAAIAGMEAEGLENPTEFDIVTAMGFCYFAEQGCDIVVLEVGLGGRLDSTNIIKAPEAAVITRLGYDHTEVLGNTLPKIAFEKAGIIKPGCDVILYPQPPEAETVFEEVCTERSARLHKIDLSGIRPREFGLWGQRFAYTGFGEYQISLLGEHQLGNAALAINAARLLQSKGFPVTENAIQKGLLSARWPGRMELVHSNPAVLIDGAHNAQGAAALKRGLQQYFPGKSVIFLAGVLADKDYGDMMREAAPLAERFLTIAPESPRALPAEALAAHLRRYKKPVQAYAKLEDAIEAGLSLCGEGGVFCAFGSLYYIGRVRAYFGLE
ncbi:MAG TPA: folylpolyglutamate synthase/dihydrofolate synthase family protein [Feifaniaceae bacterium]|nr:folylpolyglutamate synthase/dihydrofolate synthase family protein [Feifaniaceae bacterium]